MLWPLEWKVAHHVEQRIRRAADADPTPSRSVEGARTGALYVYPQGSPRSRRGRQRGTADVNCSTCGTENRPGAICMECGTGLAAGCPSSGTVNPPGRQLLDDAERAEALP